MAERRGLPLLIASAANMPMPIRVERPAEVGADRLVNALAVARLYGAPAIVVDFGTATKFDCVARDGAFVGGAIAPGLKLGMEALASRTAKLPRVDLAEPKKAIGADTVSALQSGIMLGYRALTLGLLDRIRLGAGAHREGRRLRIQVVLTGGLSAVRMGPRPARRRRRGSGADPQGPGHPVGAWPAATAGRGVRASAGPAAPPARSTSSRRRTSDRRRRPPRRPAPRPRRHRLDRRLQGRGAAAAAAGRGRRRARPDDARPPPRSSVR